MPSKSAKQAKFMRAVAHGWEPSRTKGPPKSVAKEFMRADQKAGKYAEGGLAHLRMGGRSNQETTYRGYDPRTQRGGRRGSNWGERFTDQIVDSAIAGGEPLSNKDVGPNTARSLASKGWTLAGDMWYPPEGTLGYVAEGQPRPPGMVGGYYVPRAPDPSRLLAENLMPGSLAYDMYQKYGIIDPTWTSYDLTPQEQMKEDPLAHLDPDDPARQEYESWGVGKEPVGQIEPRDPISLWPEPSPIRQDNPYVQQLREHKARIGDILGTQPSVQAGGPGGMLPPGEFIPDPEEEARGGRVNFQMGGLAAMGAMGRRAMRRPSGQMNPQMRQRMMQAAAQRRGGPGRMRGNDMRRPTPQMRQRMMQKQVGMGRPPMAQPGGPGGQPPGRGMINPGDARMPGGQAMPLRGLQQKMRAMGRRSPGGNRVGMQDQQGGLSRAMQSQTGRPPISRRAAFPGSRQNTY